MIKEVEITALKSIEHLSVPCSKLNIITGTNSSGKSTFLQALLLVEQNMDKWQGLNGALVSLGDFRRDARNYNSDAADITVTLKRDSENARPIQLSFSEEMEQEKSLLDMWFDSSGRPANPLQSRAELIAELSHLSRAERRALFHSLPYVFIRYLSCDRIGAQDLYPKNYKKTDELGANGQYAIHYLLSHYDDRLDRALIRDRSLETLFAQVNYWLDYILGMTVSVEDIPGSDYVKATYIDGKGHAARPKNVGAGASYLISILVLCLSSSRSHILLIENPEIHLHPRAQARLCEFFCCIAQSGRQLFIETHSDHIFNGVRAGIATEAIAKEDATINFFELDEKRNTINTQIEIGKNGRILNYLPGLFDQFDIDLDRMMGLDPLP